MTVTVITTCTDRKRAGTAVGPQARMLSPGSHASLQSQWRAALAKCQGTRSAREVYCGRSFREAEAAASAAKGKLAVISAGMGLIDADAVIPHYDLTLTRGAEDDVSARCTEEFDAGRWWTIVNHGNPHPIAQLMRSKPDGLFVVCLSKAYAGLVEQDLCSLGVAERQRLRLVGPSLQKHLPEPLRPVVLPYDSRLDAPGSLYSGTLSDFASRAARHFVTEVLPQRPDEGLAAHAQAVTLALAPLTPRLRIPRTSMTDDGIVDAIATALPEVGRNSARMLRHLRDTLAIACEQKRFSSLYKVAIERVSR
jgi:hypothetical protein